MCINEGVILTNEALDAPYKRLSLSVSKTKLDKKLIVHESDDLLVINKPCGLASQSGTNMKTSLDQ